MRSLVAGLAVAVALAAPRAAAADGLEVHPAEEQDWVYALEVHGALVLPFERSTVCPSGGDCVLGNGFGVGGFFVGRSPDGVGLIAGYEVWLLDGGGVYEIAALHSIRLGVRWILDLSSRAQPFLQGTIGAALLTDPGQATTAGGLVTLGGGLEVELTETVSLTFGAELAFLSVAPFSTRDGLARARDFGVNVGLEVHGGVVVLLGATGAR